MRAHVIRVPTYRPADFRPYVPTNKCIEKFTWLAAPVLAGPICFISFRSSCQEKPNTLSVKKKMEKPFFFFVFFRTTLFGFSRNRFLIVLFFYWGAGAVFFRVFSPTKLEKMLKKWQKNEENNNNK